jgi:hypothetical protein
VELVREGGVMAPEAPAPLSDGAREVVRAVFIAALSAAATRLVEWAIEEAKTRAAARKAGAS